MIWHQIVKHIFGYFGVPVNPGAFSLFTDKFLLQKELSIELEDGERLNKSVWASAGKIAGSTIKVMITNVSTSAESDEYVMILQLDELSVYAMKFDSSELENNKSFVSYDDNWIELSNLLLARLLVGVEQINELFVDYQPTSNYQELYHHLISFLNYEEATGNDEQT
jgi:hypothetical protein